ncbi:MAG: DMT family transporter [Candidatus Zixiibacteriota bacterium]|nr:MAG: DMT family transporter [candidate division Zixibacteria bacterium]
MTVPSGKQSYAVSLLILMLGALGISFSPVFVKLLGVGRIGPTAIGFWRTLSGGIVLFAIARARGKQLTVSRHALFWTTFAGFFFFIDLSSWHRSIIYAGSGMATILANTQVFSTAVLSFFIFKERLTPRYFIAALSAMVGVALLVGIYSEGVHFTDIYIRGVIYGLITGLAYGHYIVGIKKAGLDSKRPDLMVMMGWTSLASAFFLGLGSFFEPEPFLPPDATAVVLLLALGLIVQALSWWGIASSLTKIPTPTAALILLLQPTLAMVWGFVIFHEQLTVLQLLGAVITLAAIYVGSVRQAPKTSS